MHLIYNGIELPKLSSASHIRNAFPSGARVIGTIGELNKNKNQIALVEAAKADQRLFIAIVGEGEERAHLEAKIREYGLSGRVKLFGFIPAVDALRGFDAFALPSIKEGLPYVLLEARSVGLPIVFTSNIGGIAEILNAPDMSAFSIEQMIKKTVALYR